MKDHGMVVTLQAALFPWDKITLLNWLHDTFLIKRKTVLAQTGNFFHCNLA